MAGGLKVTFSPSPYSSPVKGEEFYRITVLNLDIRIYLGFRA
jgi:hypothetical protein